MYPFGTRRRRDWGVDGSRLIISTWLEREKRSVGQFPRGSAQRKGSSELVEPEPRGSPQRIESPEKNADGVAGQPNGGRCRAGGRRRRVAAGVHEGSAGIGVVGAHGVAGALWIAVAHGVARAHRHEVAKPMMPQRMGRPDPVASLRPLGVVGARKAAGTWSWWPRGPPRLQVERHRGGQGVAPRDLGRQCQTSGRGPRRSASGARRGASSKLRLAMGGSSVARTRISCSSVA